MTCECHGTYLQFVVNFTPATKFSVFVREQFLRSSVIREESVIYLRDSRTASSCGHQKIYDRVTPSNFCHSESLPLLYIHIYSVPVKVQTGEC